MIKKHEAKKILVIKPSSLGDIVHSLPFLNAVRKGFPEAEIHWLVFKGFEGLLEGHPMIDKLLVIDKSNWLKINSAGSTFNEIKSLFRSLKKEKYNLVIDLQGLLRSGVITASTGSDVRIGFKEAREGSRYFYTHKIEGGRDVHAVDRYLKIAAFLGCNISKVVFPLPYSDFSHHPSALKEYVVLVPGARWETKKWPIEKFGELASMLPYKSVIVGTENDMPAADVIIKKAGEKAVSLAGKTTLKELAEIIRKAKFMVTNDSGPMHIAAALGIPVFAIFGPTDPARTGPYGKGNRIIKADIECSPCFRKTCKELKCMDSISAEMVADIISACA